MFVYLLSSDVEKQAGSFQKRVSGENKTPNFFKETWFDEECENLLQERQLAIKKNTRSFRHAKIALLIANYDRNYRLS